ncbi:MAG: hypothetical protein V3V33_02435 [Candidatus Lokiarchaeia archaeon]
MEQDFRLVEQDFSVFKEYISILKRYIYPMLAILAVGLILSNLIAIKMPHMYKSTATILIDQTAMPDDIVKSMVTNYAEKRIQIINKKIMSSENLTMMINKFNLYQEEKEKSSLHSILNKMRENTHMEMVGGKTIIDPRTGKPVNPTVGFELSFDSKSPEIAQKIASEFVTLYMDYNLKYRSKRVEGATHFLEQETNKLRDEISNLEKKLAEFKEKNAGNLPGLNKINLTRINNIEEQLEKTNEKIRSLTENEFYLKNKLIQLDPNIATYTVTGERVYGADDRLIALKAKYVALSSKYSKGHPDLVKMRREIASLQKETGKSPNKYEYQIKLNDKETKLALLMDRYSPSHPDVKKLKLEIANLKKSLDQPDIVKIFPKQIQPNNPAYIQMQTQLMATQSELKSAQVSRRNLQEKLLRYEQSFAKTPQIEREYKVLIRDYENAMSKYGEVKAKQREANMASSMEKATKGNEFLLLEPPLIPEKPFKPNRKAIVFLGGLASIVIAIGFIMVKEMLSPSIYTPGRLALVTGTQPLAVIPYIGLKETGERQQKIIKIISFIIGVLLVTTILWGFLLKNDSEDTNDKLIKESLKTKDFLILK